MLPEEITCPYCGEVLDVTVEPLPEVQQYIEDCQVCCRPIAVTVEPLPDGSFRCSVRREDE